MVPRYSFTPSAPGMQDMEETKREAAQVVELLDLRQGGLTQTLDGGFPELRNSVWQSEISVQSSVQVCSCCRCSLICNISSTADALQPACHALCSDVQHNLAPELSWLSLSAPSTFSGGRCWE